MDGLILAGDVGGTKTQLGLFKHSAGTFELVREHRYATAQFESLEAACTDFLGASATVNAACLAVPGPIIDVRAFPGPGLWNIYRFVRRESHAEEPGWLSEQIAGGDPSAAVSEAALAGRDPVCVHALTMFCDIYGSEAANLALKVLALGGVYLGGGIAPKILPRLTNGAFVKAFLSKGSINQILRSRECRVPSDT